SSNQKNAQTTSNHPVTNQTDRKPLYTPSWVIARPASIKVKSLGHVVARYRERNSMPSGTACSSITAGGEAAAFGLTRVVLRWASRAWLPNGRADAGPTVRLGRYGLRRDDDGKKEVPRNRRAS
ncbi:MULTISPECIES: hypothetical protein, partial [unclassified Roseitalea]|uniref:hypothetical protein n=1 Tax=unclassified Roseitalea TaxID=2639107 RepID=UPI00273E0EFC